MAFIDKIKKGIDKKLEAAKLELRIGANAVAADAKSLCPVDTGKLKNSITLTEAKNGELYIVSANAKNKAGLNYAKFVEFGTYAHPFMYPALYKNIDSIRAKLKKALE